jgi:tetratricopeptide (TPR) repeat protein
LDSGSEHSINLPLVSEKEENICLPLVINVISKYWGYDINLEETLEVAKKYHGMKGSIMIEGIEIAERHNFISYIYKGTVNDLKKRIDQGVPPIVILPGIHDMVQHATIISGYSPKENRIFTYIPQPDTIGAIPESKFEEEWEQDDKVTLIIIPKDMDEIFKYEKNLKFINSNRYCFEAEKSRLQGNLNDALSKLQTAVNIDPENSQAWSLLGSIHNEFNLDHNNNKIEADIFYEKAIKLNPKYYLAFRGLGNYHLKRKNYHLAEQYYSKAIEINPNRYGPIYKNRASARLELKNYSGAKEDLLHYLEQTPTARDKKIIEDAIHQLN